MKTVAEEFLKQLPTECVSTEVYLNDLNCEPLKLSFNDFMKAGLQHVPLDAIWFDKIVTSDGTFAYDQEKEEFRRIIGMTTEAQDGDIAAAALLCTRLWDFVDTVEKHQYGILQV